MGIKIPVTQHMRKGDIFFVDSSLVVKIEKLKENVFLIHTSTDQYYLQFSFEAIEEWLYDEGFRILDRNNIVNMNKIVEFDEKGNIVLADTLGEQQATKMASAAYIHKEHVSNIMKMLDARNSDSPTVDPVDLPLNSIMKELTAAEEQPLFLRSYTAMQIAEVRNRANEKINFLAYHDALTQLPNRRLFEERLTACIAKSETNGQSPVIFFLDIDRFKMINDTLGHHVGDLILKNFSKRLCSVLAPSDTLARFSGDEFILLLPHVNNRQEAAQYAERIGEAFKQPFVFEGQELFVSASIGISCFPSDGWDTDTLIKHADTAMFQAKGKGGNAYEFYHPDMNSRSLERLYLETQLRKALAREQIRVHYQPLIDLETGAIFGMEALVRWEHPELGLISPGEFIPLAEEIGMIVPIGNEVLRQACEQNKKWFEAGHRLTVAINISMSQFQHPLFIQTIRDTLTYTGMAPEWLSLEITESVAMRDVNFVLETIEELKKIGVHISIDDFGTGYSSLSYLKRFRVHTLKIDRSFIRDVTTDEENAAIVTALIVMSQQMKMRSLAEGVETIEQLQFLKRKGCNEVQGYIFSKPLPAGQFEQLLLYGKDD